MPEKLKDFIWTGFSISRDHFLSLVSAWECLSRHCEGSKEIDGKETPVFIEHFIDICNAGSVDIELEELLDCI